MKTIKPGIGSYISFAFSVIVFLFFIYNISLNKNMTYTVIAACIFIAIIVYIWFTSCTAKIDYDFTKLVYYNYKNHKMFELNYVDIETIEFHRKKRGRNISTWIEIHTVDESVYKMNDFASIKQFKELFTLIFKANSDVVFFKIKQHFFTDDDIEQINFLEL